MIHTRDGEPLARGGDDLFDASGRHVARLRGAKAFGPDGRYLGTLVGDRLVYRGTDSAVIGPPFTRRVGSPFAQARTVGSALLGQEPRFDR
jgi:hypothetical protein